MILPVLKGRGGNSRTGALEKKSSRDKEKAGSVCQGIVLNSKDILRINAFFYLLNQFDASF